MDTIDAYGDPLAFKVNEGSSTSTPVGSTSSEQRIEVEARQMAGHQKEAVVTLHGGRRLALVLGRRRTP